MPSMRPNMNRICTEVVVNDLAVLNGALNGALNGVLNRVFLG